MVYTNPIELTENNEQIEDDTIAAFLADTIESVPEDAYFRHGYELLPQEPDILEDLSRDVTLKEMNEQDDHFFCHVKETPPVEPILLDIVPAYNNTSPLCIPGPDGIVREVWFDTSSSDIEMDSEKVEEVKQVMVNIILPPSSIPEWAANVPEEQWKEYLLNRLHIKQNKNQV